MKDHANVTEHAVTPEAAVLNWLRALETENRALFRANTHIVTEHKEYVEAKIGFCFTLRAASRERADAYGADPTADDGLLYGRATDVADALTVEQSGDSAIVRSGDDIFKVIREGGIWRVVMPLPDFDPEEPAGNRGWMQLYKAVTTAYARVRPMIGKPGVSADKVHKTFRRYTEDILTSESKRAQSPE